MPLASFAASNITPAAGRDLVIYEAGTGLRTRIVEVGLLTLGENSGVNEIMLARASGGSGLGGGTAAEKFEPESGSVGGQIYLTEGVPPTLGNVILRMPIHSDCEEFVWQAPPGGFDEDSGNIILLGQQRIVLRPAVYDPTVKFGFHLVVETL